MRMTYLKLQSLLWSLGMPTNVAEAKALAGVYRNAIKSGCDEKQAFAIVKITRQAANRYTWCVDPKNSGNNANAYYMLWRATQERNAVEHPNGKDAEDLAAMREGRPSRWGTPEFHRAALGLSPTP